MAETEPRSVNAFLIELSLITTSNARSPTAFNNAPFPLFFPALFLYRLLKTQFVAHPLHLIVIPSNYQEKHPSIVAKYLNT